MKRHEVNKWKEPRRRDQAREPAEWGSRPAAAVGTGCPVLLLYIFLVLSNFCKVHSKNKNKQKNNRKKLSWLPQMPYFIYLFILDKKEKSFRLWMGRMFLLFCFMSLCQPILFSQGKAGSVGARSEWVGAVLGRKRWRKAGEGWADSQHLWLAVASCPFLPAQHTPSWALISLAGGQAILRAPEGTEGSLYDLVSRGGLADTICCSWSGLDETRALSEDQVARLAISCES